MLFDDHIIFHCFIRLLVLNPLRASWVSSETSSQTQRKGREQRKRQGTPGWQLGILISKGILYTELVLGSSKMRGSLYLPAKSQKFMKRSQLASVTYIVQVFSTRYHYLKTMPWSSFWEKEEQAEPHSKDNGEMGEELQVPSPTHGSTTGHSFSMTFPNRDHC